MILDLAKVSFTADFFSASMPDGSLLILNNVNEDFLDKEGRETIIKRINIVVSPVDGEVNVLCPSVIGMGNKYFRIDSDHEEYLGKALDIDNMQYCTLELYENV